MGDFTILRANVRDESLSKINWKAFAYYAPLIKIEAYVRQHPDTSLTLMQAASIAGMESTHFSKFFRKKTGVRFKYWEDLRKVERAVSLFETNDISVTEAALKVGFNDLTTFERAFKRIKQKTPREYKRHLAA